MGFYVRLISNVPYNPRLEMIMFTKFLSWLTEGEREWSYYGASLISVKKPNKA